MAGLMKNVLITASRRAHQGAMGMLVPGLSPSSSPCHSPRHSPCHSPRRTFATAGKPATPMTDDEELKIKRLFTAYDKNHDGWISRGEWYDVVHKFLGDKDAAWILAEKIMDDLDVDPKDEKVTYSEFRAGMKSHWHLFKPKINNVNK